MLAAQVLSVFKNLTIALRATGFQTPKHLSDTPGLIAFYFTIEILLADAVKFSRTSRQLKELINTKIYWIA